MTPRSHTTRLLAGLAFLALAALALQAPAAPLSAQAPSPTLPPAASRLFVPLVNRWYSEGGPLVEVPAEQAQIAYVWPSHAPHIGTMGEIYLANRNGWLWPLTKPVEGEVYLYPAHLTWSPDGQWLVYARTTAELAPSGDLYLLDFSQGVQVVGPYGIRVTDGPDMEVWPTFSPAGDEVAFIEARGPTRTLAIRNVVYAIAGMDPPVRRLASPGLDPVMPVWSPTGEWIAFVSGSGLYVIRPDGSDLLPVASGARVQRPTWSPDGGGLAYASDHTSVGSVIVDAERGERLHLVSCAGSDPDWSPTGGWIAYSAPTATATAAVHIMRAEGTDVRVITGGPGYADEDPAWSPDGRYIAFRRTLLVESGGEWTGDSSIQVVRMDGTGAVRVSSIGHRRALDHAWRPTVQRSDATPSPPDPISRRRETGSRAGPAASRATTRMRGTPRNGARLFSPSPIPMGEGAGGEARPTVLTPPPTQPIIRPAAET